MVTDMATTIDPNPREAALDVEYPIQLAYTREPVMCLAGTVSVISPGRRDLALPDVEWQDLDSCSPKSKVEKFTQPIVNFLLLRRR